VISPDGQWVAYDLTTFAFDTNARPSDADSTAGWSRQQQLWLAPADGAAPARQVTFGDADAQSPVFSPDGRTLAFLRDVRGTTRIHFLPLNGGEAQVLGTGALEPQAFQFSPDGTQIAFTAIPPRDRKAAEEAWRAGGAYDWEGQWQSALLYATSARGGEPVLLSLDKRNVLNFAWAPDGKALALVTSGNADPYVAWTDNSVQIVSSVDGRILHRFEDELSTVGDIRFSPNGRKLAFTVTRGTGTSILNALMVHDLQTGRTTNVAAQLDPTFGSFTWTDDSTIVAHAYERTKSRLFRLHVDRGNPEVVGVLGRSIDAGFSVTSDGTRLATLTSAMLEATSPTVIDATTGAYRTVADVNPQVREWLGFKHDIVTWRSPEGPSLEGILAYAPDGDPGQPAPLMVFPHGGPDWVSLESFNQSGQWVHFFTALGFNVFQPNYRGGIAYGVDFLNSNRARLGEIEFMDIEAGVDHLIEQGLADENRLVYGSFSWGGYLTAWTIGHSHRYRAAVAVSAVTDVIGEYVESDINRGIIAERDYGGDPWEATREYDESNPIRFLADCTTPTLVIHGLKDVRVPFTQGLALYRALSDLGVETALLAYPREPHGFVEPAHIEHMLNAWAKWYLDRVPGLVNLTLPK